MENWFFRHIRSSKIHLLCTNCQWESRKLKSCGFCQSNLQEVNDSFLHTNFNQNITFHLATSDDMHLRDYLIILCTQQPSSETKLYFWTRVKLEKVSWRESPGQRSHRLSELRHTHPGWHRSKKNRVLRFTAWDLEVEVICRRHARPRCSTWRTFVLVSISAFNSKQTWSHRPVAAQRRTTCPATTVGTTHDKVSQNKRVGSRYSTLPARHQTSIVI